MDDAWAIAGAGVDGLDDEALAQAAADDRTAFAAIYERYRTPVYRYLRSRTASDDEAGELTAVTFEHALGAIARFTPTGGGMVAWLLRIARNAHTDAVRQQARRRTFDDRTAKETGRGATRATDDDVILRSLVEALSPIQRDAIQLRFAAGLTAREIGAVLGITEAAAQKQVERALRALKEAYGVD